MKKIKIIGLFSFFLLLTSSLFSQEKKKDLWETKLSLGTYFYTGNTEKFDFTSDFQLTRKDSVLETKLFLTGAYGELEKVQNKQEFKGGLKFDYNPFSKFSPFILLSLYNNEFKDIELRISSFIGAKYLFYKTDKSNYSLSAALQYDTERYYESSTNKEKIRLSLRPRFKQTIGKNMKLQALCFYQPNLQDFDDYMVIANISVSTKVFEKMDLKLTYNYDYESMPALETIKKTDTSFITSIVLNF